MHRWSSSAGSPECSKRPLRLRTGRANPQWATATVEVERTVKGSAGSTVDVLFAISDDVMWYRAPKLAVGQHAVFLLHEGVPATSESQSNAVIDQLDVQATDVAPLIADLL